MGTQLYLPDGDYRAIKALNWSLLRHMRKSPAHFDQARRNPEPPGPSLVLGQAVHCLALTPNEWHNSFAVAPDVDRRTKEGKASWATFVAYAENKTIITADVFQQAQTIASRVAPHITQLDACRFEVSATWETRGVDCKGRIDLDLPAMNCIIDLKTTRDASPDAFARSLFSYGYYGQAAWYLDGMAAAGQPRARVGIIAVEVDPPYAVATYDLSDRTIDAGRAEYERLLARYIACEESGEWPDYRTMYRTLDLPAWAERAVYASDE